MAIRPEQREESEGVESEDEKDEGVVKMGGIGERTRAEKEEERVKRMHDPRKPTVQEVEDHNRTHLPYRNWCPYCVQAKGKDLDHRKSIKEERGLAEFSFDYCFPADESGYRLTGFGFWWVVRGSLA